MNVVRRFHTAPIFPITLTGAITLSITSTQLTDGLCWNHEHATDTTTENGRRAAEDGQNAAAQFTELVAYLTQPVCSAPT